MSTTHEIIRGISQAAGLSYDGATDSDGEPIKVGLRREEGNPLIDKRIIDGFSVSFTGNGFCVHYHTELTMKDFHNIKDLEGELDSTIQKVASFLKKEYKKITGSSLSISPEGECVARVEYISRVRCWVTCKKHFKINNAKGLSSGTNEPYKVDPEVERFMKLGGLKGD